MRSDTRELPAESREPARRPQAAGHVLIAGFVGLVLALFLNAPSILERAETMELGAKRTVALTFMRPVAEVSSTVRLDRPRLALDAVLGRSAPDIEAPAPAPEPEEETPDPRVDPTLFPPTEANPADAWIIGDSLVELLGPHLSNLFDDSQLVTPEVDFRFISGLTRPEYFDWPTHIAERMRTDPPQIVVVMFGGNDGQSVIVEGELYEVWTPEWWDLYRARIAEAMDALQGDHMRAYWIGLPVMKSETFSERARQLNEAYRAGAEERPWVTYIETWDVFTDADGNYADYLPGAGGNMRLMRYEDGVHFTPPGALRLARHVYDELAPDWDLPPR